MAETTSPSHQLIICTKDRPDSLRDALNSVLHQPNSPECIIVVDSSIDDGSELVAREFQEHHGLKIKFFKSGPGLTFQRNFAIERIENSPEIVHFIDDDSILQPNYFVEILDCFRRHPTALGVGGAITNLPVHKFSRFNLAVGLDSKDEGRVLKSGINILNFTGDSDREVDWVSGCSMSFRYSIFDQIKFDERRKGNGTGEDVDFCLRLNQLGRLIWTPRAKVFHNQSPINRESGIKIRLAVVRHFLRLSEDGLGSVRKRNIYTAQLALTLIRLLKSIRHRKFEALSEELSFWRAIVGK